MNIHRIYYPTLALGPGRRIGIWTRGCDGKCAGCMSSDLWERKPECEMDLADVRRAVLSIASRAPVDGATISGGEPLDQGDELFEFLDFLGDVTSDVLLYTGCSASELRERGCLERLRNLCSAVVCGPYVEEKTTARR